MQKQKGFTVLNMVSTALAVAFAALLAVRVVPVYIHNYEVRASISALKELKASVFSDDSMTNAAILRSKLIAQFDINGFTEYKPEDISIVPANNGRYLVSLKYRVIRPLLYNVSLMFDFNEAEEISVNTN